jgi:lysophospholipase L1-like esterase
MLGPATLSPQTPAQLGNIPAVKYWLDAGTISGVADGATISASDWRDGSSSRRGVLASATACVYRRDGGNGRPAIEFNGTSSIAVSPSFALLQPMRVFMVAKPLSFSATNEKRYIDGGATVNRGVIDQGPVAPAPDRYGRIYGGSAWACTNYSTYLPWNAPSSSVAAGPVGLWRLFDATFNGASSSLAMEFNPAKAGNPGSQGYQDGVTLGAATGGLAGFFCHYQLAELVICDGSIMPGDVALAVKAHLMRKHRLARNGALVCNGSSLTAGLGVSAGTEDWPSQLSARLSGPAAQWHVENFGVSAQPTPDAITYATSHADIWASVFAQTFMFLDGGTWGNDIVLNNPGATAAYNNYVSYFTGRQAAGFAKQRCIAFTAGPRSDITSGRETDRQTVNTSIRNNWPSFAGALVDIDADSRLTTPAQDGVHYSAAQYSVWADLVRRAMLPLMAA